MHSISDPPGTLYDHFHTGLQVKIAEHVLTQHKVAIKILNKRKIKQQDMEEKGVASICSCNPPMRVWLVAVQPSMSQTDLQGPPHSLRSICKPLCLGSANWNEM